MALDQQALVEMFRQGFSPLADLSAGQLQLAIGQQQRDYAARQQQAQRAQAMQDHITGIQTQARLQRENQLAIEGARFSNDRTITADRTAAGLAQADMERYWRTLDKGDETLTDLRRIAAAQGLDTTEFKDAVSLTSGLAKHVKAKTERLTGEATDLYLSLYDAENALTEANAKTQLTEADRVKIVLPYALAAAGKDEKLKASLFKMTSADDIATELSLKVEMADVTIKRMGDALAVKENSLRSTHASAIRSASVAADRINRQILDLPPGTTPDRAVLKKRGVPAPVARGVSPEDQALNDAEMVDGLFQPSAGVAAPSSAVAPVGAGWGFLGDAARVAASAPDMALASADYLGRGVKTITRAAIGDKGLAALRGSGPVIDISADPYPSLFPQRPRVPMINIPRQPVPTIDISGAGIPRPRVPMINIPSQSLAGLMDQGVTIDSLINRVQDPTLAGQFRAMRADPMGQPSLEDALAQIFGSGGAVLDQAAPAWQY